MKTIQKLSLVGVVLMGASAVTAAVLPSHKKTNTKFANNGKMVFSANNTANGSSDPFYQKTCKPSLVALKTCVNTDSAGVGSSTSAGGRVSSNQTTD